MSSAHLDVPDLECETLLQTGVSEYESVLGQNHGLDEIAARA